MFVNSKDFELLQEQVQEIEALTVCYYEEVNNNIASLKDELQKLKQESCPHKTTNCSECGKEIQKEIQK
jgi:hypothetical protein